MYCAEQKLPAVQQQDYIALYCQLYETFVIIEYRLMNVAYLVVQFAKLAKKKLI